MSSLLSASDISFAYPGKAATLNNVSIAINEGEGVGIVGESGSGKSTLLKLILGIHKVGSGNFTLKDQKIDFGDRTSTRDYRRSVQVVFQDPFSSLDPRQRIDRLVAEPLISLGLVQGDSRSDKRAWIENEVTEVLTAVGLPLDSMTRYPREFSGGQRQRIAIARAIVSKPALLLADEPVSALDVSTRVRIVELLASLRESRGLSIMMVSHDLSVIAALCEKTAVINQGSIVEFGDTTQVLGNPQNEYTRTLIESIPRIG